MCLNLRRLGLDQAADFQGGLLAPEHFPEQVGIRSELDFVRDLQRACRAGRRFEILCGAFSYVA